MDKYPDDLHFAFTTDTSFLLRSNTSNYLASSGNTPTNRRDFAIMHCRKSLLKKYEPSRKSKDYERISKASLEDFEQRNIAAAVPPGWLLSGPHGRLVSSFADRQLIGDESSTPHPYIDLIINDIRSLLYKWLDGSNVIDGSEILGFLNTGPGKALGCPDFDFYSKVGDGPLTISSARLYQWLMQGVTATSPFGRALRARHAKHGVVTDVNYCKVTDVPKTFEVTRIIAIEPSGNQMLDLAFGTALSIRLRRIGVDLRNQQFINRLLARQGSIDGNIATLDLKNASDFPLWVIALLCPPSVVGWVDLLRSKFYVLETEDGLSEPRLMNFAAPMGNGFTFPLETLIFHAITRVCCDYLGISTRNHTFGDDIIVDSRASSLVTRVLTDLCFTVNTSKSYCDGNFRESCGGDYFYGHPVRGVYITSLRSPAEIYSAINRLNVWCMQHHIEPIQMFDTYTCLFSRLKRLAKEIFWVPLCEEGDCSGIRIPFWATGFHGKMYKRLIPDPRKKRLLERQRMSFRASRARVGRVGVKGYSRAKCKWLVRTSYRCPLLGNSEVPSSPRGWQALSSNDTPMTFAYILAALRGDIRGGRISIRVNEVRWKVETVKNVVSDVFHMGDVNSLTARKWLLDFYSLYH